MFTSKILSEPSYITSHNKDLLSKLENNPVFQTVTTHKINKTLHDSGEMLSHLHIRKTKEKIDGPNVGKYKIITQLPSNHNEKEQLEVIVKVIDYIVARYGIEKEISMLIQ